MTKVLKHVLLYFLVGLLAGCSQVLQNIDLNINAEDDSLQEKFNVVEKTLTIKEAKKQKTAPYSRTVIKNGRGETAKPIPEKLALKSNYPKNNLPIEYKIDIGDTITFSKLIENNRSPLSKTSNWPEQTVSNKYKQKRLIENWLQPFRGPCATCSVLHRQAAGSLQASRWIQY